MQIIEMMQFLQWAATKKRIHLCVAHQHTSECKQMVNGVPWECGLAEFQYAPITGYEGLILEYEAVTKAPVPSTAGQNG